MLPSAKMAKMTGKTDISFVH